MKDPDYVMKKMASWMTLDELEGARSRIDLYTEVGGSRIISSNTGSRLGFILDLYIRCMITIIGYMRQFH